ncbi:MAG: cbb3-type cytochrome oxidase assembly protein CcoS [Burkholderiales bacterium]|nr:cbb3-type cytochrome oxidase assembly protein CcoS [Burkholderiales bacterium]
MDILFLLIPLSVVLVLLIGAVFWLALKGGQFDDLESPGLNVVLDDDNPEQVAPESEPGPDGGDTGRHTG